MTSAEQLIERIHAAGGILTLKGDRIVAEVPEEAAPLLHDLRALRDEAYHLILERETIPPMPAGVRLVAWNPKSAPVMITRWAVVTDVPGFVRCTLRQLEHAIAWEAGDENRRWLAGHRTSRELQDYLSQVGCVVEIEEAQRRVVIRKWSPPKEPMT